MDSTIHIKSLFPAQSLSYADWLHAFSNFQLVACWLHGKCKYSILSFLFAKYLVESAPKTVYIKVCEVTNFYADILLYSALDVLLMLGTCWILDNSASEQSCVTRHLISGSLGTWCYSALEHLIHSALDNTRHLNLLSTRHLLSLGTWMLCSLGT
jgi:hypothetical protein